MINAGEEQVKEIFAGEMGVKIIAVGDELIHTRPGGYFYLELETKEEE